MRLTIGSSLGFSGTARNEIAKGVYAVADLVQTTMGPMGKNVIIERRYGYPLVTKDGVTVARHIVLLDPAPSVGVKLCQEVAQKTNDLVGDGTTTSIVLFASMVRQGMKLLEAGYNSQQLKKGMELALQSACDKLEKMSIPADSIEKILSVSTVSSKDMKIGRLIAEAMERVGINGIITVGSSQQKKSFVEVSSGLEIEKGYTTPNFITKGDRMMIELEEAFVFMTDCPITTVNEMDKILNWCVANKRSLLLIANDIRRDALGALVWAKKSGRVNGVAIEAMGSGQQRLDFLEDIAVYTGGSVVSTLLGSSLDSCRVSTCGKADRIVVTGGKTVISNGQGKTEDIEKRIRQLRTLLEMSSSKEEQAVFKNRIANLSDGIAVIQVGGITDIEMQELKYRVEDGVHAAQTAVISGILPGGGKAAWWVAQNLKDELESIKLVGKNELNDGLAKGYEIVIKAMEEPMIQMLKNAGKDYVQIIKSLNSVQSWVGFDIVTNQMTDMLRGGIVDPSLTIISSLRNSISSASMLLTCEALVGEGLFTKSQPELKDLTTY
ncbi:chaperonin GroEL [Dehalobacter restrictus]|jgi:chaperonin GroEL|uniref:60 kDa chaperonin n=1 Tax=Dehalobacter restrictus (strain DSM 9455 / PER-K23) TaxID=871738 RepID=A0ABM5P473_DEHRP|nr:chaperonin GroEL [Dehalobacter restrictus]AHF09341.1 chaperonin [Dehalobacter restrictus DSM 9455]